MKIPEITILNKPTTKFFLYAAADREYFDVHGKPLINSVMANTNHHIHVHIINPTLQQLRWCAKIDRLTTSYELIDVGMFTYVATKWLSKTDFKNHRQVQMFEKGNKFGILTMKDIIEKTYYACCRFIRLKHIKSPESKCLSLDIDGLVRNDFPIDLDDNDIYLYQKSSGEHLAGAIMFNPDSDKFIHEYSDKLVNEITHDNLYWFLDQVILDEIIDNYSKGLLPMSYIDWEMLPTSAIWSAKGKRKDSQQFIDEQKKYIL